MKFLFMRLSPWLIAGVAGFLSAWQWRDALIYPWPLVIVWALAFFAVCAMAWRELTWRDTLEKMAPSFVTLAIVGFAFLLVEGSLTRFVTSLVFLLIPLVSLELLFLFLYDPTRYPVNGLSRFNIALVPVAGFFLASTWHGLGVFLQMRSWVSVASFILLGASFYFLTTHPNAHRTHRRRWMLLGGLLGGQIGLLGLLLPVSMAVQGALASLLLCLPMRIRRYAYQPQPSFKMAWSEGVLALAGFVALLFTARWA